MTSLRHVLVCAALAALLAQAFHVQAQKKTDKDDPKPAEQAKPAPRKFTDKEVADAHKALEGLDGEQVMMLNGLRYLMRPAAEEALMTRRFYVPSPLPSYDTDNKKPMTPLEVLRLWVILESGMPVDEPLKRELNRFLKIIEHKRFNDSLAAYAVPLMVCRAAQARTEFSGDKTTSRTLEKLAKALSELGTRPRELTDEVSPLIKGKTIAPMWYANHLWRGVMTRAAVEMNIDVNEKLWETDLKNLAYNANDKLGWVTGASGFTAGTDLDTNLMAAAAFTLALQASRKSVGSSTRNAIEKKFDPQALFTRLEKDWKDELFMGARLCLVRSSDPNYAPQGKDGYDWRHAMRERAVYEQMASGVIYTERALAFDLGLCGITPLSAARDTVETALHCLSMCGGLFRAKDSPIEPPLKGLSSERVNAAIAALSLLHAYVAPTLADGVEDPVLELRVNEAIDKGVAWLKEYQESNGTFDQNYTGITAIALTAMMDGGIKRDEQCIQQGVGFIVKALPDRLANPRGDGVRAKLNAYEAGMLLVMFLEYYEETVIGKGVLKSETPNQAIAARSAVWNVIPQVHRDLIQKLVDYLDQCYAAMDQGGWGYYPKNGPTGHSDNSISQYAGCGYKAASLLGAKVDVNIFEAEALTLIGQYSIEANSKKLPFRIFWEPPEEDEKVKAARYLKGGVYAPRHWKGSINPGGWSYGRTKKPAKGQFGMSAVQYVGTGMAMLAMAKDELWARGKLTDDLHQKIDLHIFGAQAWLATRIPDVSEPLDQPRDPNAEDKKPQGQHARADWVGGWGGNYNLYALERGCVMANIRKLNGEVDWYRSAATILCNVQSDDGNWGDPLSTARAILILRRHAPPMVTQPPPPPPPRDKPRNPTTGDPPLKQPKSPITPGPVKREPKPAEPRAPVTGPGENPESR